MTKACAAPDHAGPNPLPVSEFGEDSRKPDGLKARCRQCVAVAERRRRAADPQKQRQVERRGRQKNPEKRREQDRERDRRRRTAARAAVFGHYGKTCACCGTAGRLNIDHVNGDGAAHRKQAGVPAGGVLFYLWLIRNGLPGGYQTLCFPCNASKRDGERCRLDHSGVQAKGAA